MLFKLRSVLVAECPQKVKEITENDIKNYFSKYHKKLDGLKVDCQYDRNSNIFNFTHKMKATGRLGKSVVDFDLTTHSSIFNLFDFKDFKGTLCHSKVKKKGVDDYALVKKSFFNRFFKKLEDQKANVHERNGQICYSAEVKRRVLLI